MITWYTKQWGTLIKYLSAQARRWMTKQTNSMLELNQSESMILVSPKFVSTNKKCSGDCQPADKDEAHFDTLSVERVADW